MSKLRLRTIKKLSQFTQHVNLKARTVHSLLFRGQAFPLEDQARYSEKEKEIMSVLP